MPTFTRLHLYLEVANTGTQIKGDSYDQGFEDQILLTGVNWKIEQPKPKAEEEQSGAMGERMPEPGVLELSKFLDKASTAMLNQFMGGAELNAQIVLASHQVSGFELNIALAGARITDYKVNVKDSEKGGDVEEDWTFTYEGIEFTYVPETTSGQGGKPLSAGPFHRSPDADNDKDKKITELVKNFESFNPGEKRLAWEDLRKLYAKDFKLEADFGRPP